MQHFWGWDLKILRFRQKSYFFPTLFPNLDWWALLLCGDLPSTSKVWPITMLIRRHDYCTGEPQAAHSKRPLPEVRHSGKFWRSDRRNVHQSCSPWSEGSFLHHNLSFQRIWHPHPSGLTTTPAQNLSGLSTGLKFVFVTDPIRPMLTSAGVWRSGEEFSSQMNPGFNPTGQMADGQQTQADCIYAILNAQSRDTVRRSSGLLMGHSWSCTKPMASASVHNTWKLKTSQLLHNLHARNQWVYDGVQPDHLCSATKEMCCIATPDTAWSSDPRNTVNLQNGLLLCSNGAV